MTVSEFKARLWQFTASHYLASYQTRKLPMSGIMRCFIALVCTLVLMPSGVAFGQVPELQVVIIGDTDDDIGEGCRIDIAAVTHLFTKNLPEGRTANPVVFAGTVSLKKPKGEQNPNDRVNNFFQEDILKHLDTMQVNENTGVVVYFSGHGDFTPGDGHRMVIPTRSNPADGRLPNEEVFRRLQRRNIPMRFVAVITDSCAPNVGDSPRRKLAEASFPVARFSKRIDALDDLFFKSRGLLDINGCSEDQCSFGPASTGGLFTVGLIEALTDNTETLRDDVNGDRILEWHEVFPKIISHTEGNFDACNKILIQKGQRPLAGPNNKPQASQTPQAYRITDQTGKPVGGGRWKVGMAVNSRQGGGVVVDEVLPDGPADGILQKGDVIHKLGGRSLRSSVDYACTVDFATKKEILVNFTRQGKMQSAVINMVER